MHKGIVEAFGWPSRWPASDNYKNLTFGVPASSLKPAETLACRGNFLNPYLNSPSEVNEEANRAWVVLSFADKRSYAGNAGYQDEPESVYRYDSNVPNHKNVTRGDLIFVPCLSG